MVRRSRQLKREKGILADPDPKRGGRQVSEDVKERIMNFYQSEEYSRTCPGKKDFVTMKEDGEKVHKQKQLLLVNLKELYVEYKSKYSASSVIRTSIIRILDYPNPQNSCLIKTFCNTFSMYFTYPNFSLIRTKFFFSWPKGFG